MSFIRGNPYLVMFCAGLTTLPRLQASACACILFLGPRPVCLENSQWMLSWFLCRHVCGTDSMIRMTIGLRALLPVPLASIFVFLPDAFGDKLCRVRNRIARKRSGCYDESPKGQGMGPRTPPRCLTLCSDCRKITPRFSVVLTVFVFCRRGCLVRYVSDYSWCCRGLGFFRCRSWRHRQRGWSRSVRSSASVGAVSTNT